MARSTDRRERRVRRALGGQTFGRPELPPVEVPEAPLEDQERLRPIQGAPGVPALLVSTAQEPEVVRLEAGGPAQVARLEPDEAAGSLEQDLLGVPRQAGARRVQGEPVVGPLIQVR